MICACDQEIKLINQLNDFYSFDHNVFLLDSATDMNCFVNTRTQEEFTEFTPQSLYVLKNVGDNITGLETLNKIKSKNTFIIVVPQSSEFKDNFKLLAQLKKIQRLQISMKIGVFFSHIVASDNLQSLFQWFWKNQIINIFAAFHSYDDVIRVSSAESSLNIFTFNPFGSFDVINVTGSKSFNNLFLSQYSNFQQHPLVLGMGKSFDWYSDEYLWLAVFRVMNASYTKIDNNRTLSFANGIDILPVLHEHIEDIHLNMYPMYINSIVLVVPEAVEYSEFAAYLQSITTHRLFGYCLMIVAIVMLLLIIFRYIKRAEILLVQSITDVLNLIMNDNGAIKYQQLSRVEACLILPLTFAGLIFVNGLLSNFQSYLTRPIKQAQIDTIDDIYKSPFPIFTWTQSQSNVLLDTLENLSKHTGWSNKIQLSQDHDHRLLWLQIVKYNQSISFLMELSYANTLLRVQKRVGIEGYHICETRFSKRIYAYLINDEFPFIERINEIVHWIRDAGIDF